MSKANELSPKLRALIIAYHRIGKSNRQIANELQLNQRTVASSSFFLMKREVVDPKC